MKVIKRDDNMINYVIGIGAVLIVILLFRNLIKKGREGNGGCCGGCNGCSSVNQCNHKQ